MKNKTIANKGEVYKWMPSWRPGAYAIFKILNWIWGGGGYL